MNQHTIDCEWDIELIIILLMIDFFDYFIHLLLCSNLHDCCREIILSFFIELIIIDALSFLYLWIVIPCDQPSHRTISSTSSTLSHCLNPAPNRQKMWILVSILTFDSVMVMLIIFLQNIDIISERVSSKKTQFSLKNSPKRQMTPYTIEQLQRGRKTYSLSQI